MAIKHLVLHVGGPKTGTSLIQRSLRTLRPQLRQRGIAYVDRSQMQRLEHRMSWGGDARGPAAGKSAFAAELKGVVKSARREVAGRLRTVLLSNEAMIGRAGPGFGDPYWPRAAEGIGEVIAALSPRRTDVLVYVRRQDRLLESMYMQQIHVGKSLTWEDFFANAGGDDRVRYRDLMEVIEGLPTVESTRVRPFEIIEGGAAPFVADFLAYFGADDLTPLLTDFAPSNPPYTQPAWESALQINPHLRTEEQIRETRKFLKKLFPPEKHPPAALMTPDERLRLLEIYGPANLSFFRDYLPDYPADSYLSDEATERLGSIRAGREAGVVR